MKRIIQYGIIVIKGYIMQVSSSTSTTTDNSQNLSSDPMKKAMQVQERQVMKILESTNQQVQQTNAQKTGMGQNINLMA